MNKLRKKQELIKSIERESSNGQFSSPSRNLRSKQKLINEVIHESNVPEVPKDTPVGKGSAGKKRSKPEPMD